MRSLPTCRVAPSDLRRRVVHDQRHRQLVEPLVRVPERPQVEDAVEERDEADDGDGEPERARRGEPLELEEGDLNGAHRAPPRCSAGSPAAGGRRKRLSAPAGVPSAGERERDVGRRRQPGVERAGEHGGAGRRERAQRGQHGGRLLRCGVLVQFIEHEDRRPGDAAQRRSEQQPVGGAQRAHGGAVVEREPERLEHLVDVRAAPAPAVQGQLHHDLVGHGERLVEVVDPAELAEAGEPADAAWVAVRIEAGDGELALAGLHACRDLSSRAVLPDRAGPVTTARQPPGTSRSTPR